MIVTSAALAVFIVAYALIATERVHRVAAALGHPLLRQGSPHIARLAAVATGIGLPLALHEVIGPGRAFTGVVMGASIIGGAVIVRLKNRIEGWRLTLFVLATVAIISVVR